MPTKILVVDDEPKIVENVKAYLEAASYQVVTAGDGLQALEVFRREQPDLVVLDLMMPQMHGLDVARSIRSSSSVPIIMLTAVSEEIDKIVGLEAGADDYVTKPFNPRELVARVRAVLRRSETQSPAEARKVFVSSVMKGYERERQAVREAIYDLHNAGVAVRPVMAEHFPADPEPPRAAILQELDSSHAYVGVFGRRYGYINPETDQSATEEEYRRARERGIPILVFIERLPPGQEREPRQEAFVREVMDYAAGHFVTRFENPDQLRFESYRALQHLLAPRAA